MKKTSPQNLGRAAGTVLGGKGKEAQPPPEALLYKAAVRCRCGHVLVDREIYEHRCQWTI